MQTTHPSIMLGSYTWDEDRLPRDEFDCRLTPLRAYMKERGWAAVMIYGDAREHGDLAFFTNFIPRMRWALAMIPLVGEPLLLTAMSSRDLPAMQTMTWIKDVKSGWEWEWFDKYVEGFKAAGAIGAIGFDLMTPQLFDKVEQSLDDKHKIEFDDEIAKAARSIHRPREISLIALAADIARSTAEAIRLAWRDGVDLETAALVGERAARRCAVQDVRTLVSRDGGITLEPYSGRFDCRPAHLLAYVAVKMMGYWGEAFVVSDNDPLKEGAQKKMDELLKSFRRGASYESLSSEDKMSKGFLGSSIGHRIGLSLNEGSELVENSTVQANVAYALRTASFDGAGRAAVASATAWVDDDGALHILTRNV